MNILAFFKDEKLTPERRVKFKELLVAQNSKRLFYLLVFVAAIELVLAALHLVGFLEWNLQIFIFQISVLSICVVTGISLFYLRKHKSINVLAVFVSIMHGLCLLFAVGFSALINISGHVSFGTFYIGTFIVTLTFIRKPLVSIIFYATAYFLLTIYTRTTYRVDLHLVSEIINATIFAIMLAISSFFLYKQSKKAFLQGERISKANEKLKMLSITDDLTQLYNRRKVYGELEREISYAQRYKTPLSVILIDIDHFKNVNDNYGHGVGDTVLKEFARILKSSLRITDIVGRWGGEEFIVVCTNTNLESAKMLANRLRRIIAGRELEPAGKITISAGVSEFENGENTVDIIERADEALYCAKTAGRNCVKEIGVKSSSILKENAKGT